MVMLLEGCIKARLNMIIAGGTGSGKTTLLKLIAGMERPTAGQVQVRGHDVTRERTSALSGGDDPSAPP